LPPVEFSPASEVEKIARPIITKHHSELVNVHVEFVFRSKVQVSKGKEIWGKARKLSGLNAYLADVSEDEDFFVIEIAKDIWATLTDGQKKALVDHELCHCVVDYGEEDGEAKLSIAPHDVEEFAEIVRRHGLWANDVKHFVQAAQGVLDLPVKEEEKEPAA
jgi:predicted metallopeptidase